MSLPRHEAIHHQQDAIQRIFPYTKWEDRGSNKQSKYDRIEKNSKSSTTYNIGQHKVRLMEQLHRRLHTECTIESSDERREQHMSRSLIIRDRLSLKRSSNHKKVSRSSSVKLISPPSFHHKMKPPHTVAKKIKPGIYDMQSLKRDKKFNQVPRPQFSKKPHHTETLTKDYLELAREYKAMEPYRYNNPNLRTQETYGRNSSTKCIKCKNELNRYVHESAKIFFPCEHVCICFSCYQSDFQYSSSGNDELSCPKGLQCPICCETVKLVLNYYSANRSPREIYWSWVNEVCVILHKKFDSISIQNDLSTSHESLKFNLQIKSTLKSDFIEKFKTNSIEKIECEMVYSDDSSIENLSDESDFTETNSDTYSSSEEEEESSRRQQFSRMCNIS